MFAAARFIVLECARGLGFFYLCTEVVTTTPYKHGGKRMKQDPQKKKSKHTYILKDPVMTPHFTCSLLCIGMYSNRSTPVQSTGLFVPGTHVDQRAPPQINWHKVDI